MREPGTATIPTADLSGSDGPLLEVVRQGPLDVPPKLFSAIALLAVANGALINMIMASRLVYGMARRGSSREPSSACSRSGARRTWRSRSRP